MLRALLLAMMVLTISQGAPNQKIGVLHIKVTLVDAAQKVTPVPRHTLLISDNPASAAPRQIVTKLDGTADVNLRPGNYTIESDRPVSFGGKAYQWRQTLDVAAGRDVVLELTVANAEVGPLSADAASAGEAGAPPEADPAFLLPQWQDSIVALWTPTAHGTGFVIGTNGLVATSQRVVGTATSVEVQLTATLKVTGTVLAANPSKEIAILWVDPKVTASLRPVPLACAGDKSTVRAGDKVFALGAPLRQQKDITPGVVNRIDEHHLTSDLMLAPASEGGPVFAAAGDLIGVSSVLDESDARRRADARIVRATEACDVVAAAEKKMANATPPSGTHLPVEPDEPFPVDTFRSAAEHRVGSVSPYQLSTPAFDVTFITPVLTYAAQYQADHPPRTTSKDTRKAEPEPTLVRPLLDFSNWSNYVDSFPPVLLVRVTPKMVEGFWTTVGRVAARSQGVSIPPIKHFGPGFSRLRAFCGEAEVTPIHPFKLEQRISDTDAIYEGLYVFDPSALGPECGTVKVMLYGEKEPDKPDTRVVDAKMVQQIWQDFAPFRDQKR